MNEKALKQAFLETADERIFSKLNLSFDYETSKSFDKKMKKLCKKYNHISFKLTYTSARKVICILAAILILMLSSLSVGAVRDIIKNFFVEHFSTHATFQYKNNSNNKDYPKTIETYYQIDPKSGFKLVEESKTKLSAVSYYEKGENDIFMIQWAKDEFDVDIDNEHSEYRVEIIDGQKYFIISYYGKKGYGFIWDNGEYIFDITSNLDKKELLNLCKTLKVKK